MKSNIEISDDKKVEILVAIMHDVRSNINAWTNRAFNAITWSSGFLIALNGWWLTKDIAIESTQRLFLILVVSIFGLLIQIYLSRVYLSHRGNGNVLSKIEIALRLSEDNQYLLNQDFFKPSNKWLTPYSLIILQILNLIIILITIIILMLF